MEKKAYLVCVDSDGCAMDTMNSKHLQCFGPAMVEVWGLEEKQEEVLACWNRVNLFSETRGINRFLALRMVLEEKGRPCDLDGFDAFCIWTERTRELSASSLKCWMGQEEHDTECCRRAYRWTLLVNEKISRMPAEGNKAFPGVLGALRQLQEKAAVAVVSSANRAAVEEEWTREGLLDFVDVLMTQEDGSKSVCIRKLLEQGYQNNHVLMVGDAPGDLDAARENGVLFYPILANREAESWSRLKDTFFGMFLENKFCGDVEKEQEAGFYENLEMLSKEDGLPAAD